MNRNYCRFTMTSRGLTKVCIFIVLVSVPSRLPVVQTVYTAEKETEIRAETVLNAAYDPVSRPQSQTRVKCGLNILAIDELNLKGQKLTMAGWLTFEWEDERLTWNKTAKDDIEYIFTRPDYVWKPEVVIDNSIENLGIVKNSDMLLRVRNTGGVEWQPPIMFTVHCQVDVTYYPYDRQKCAVEIVSWAYTYEEVLLDHLFAKVNLEDFERHGEWRISKTTVENKNLTEHIPGGSVRVYPQLDFWLYMQRRTEYYNLNVMMPIILTSLMAVLVFMVPVHSGEKVSYVLTIFLSLAVLLTIVADSLPPTSITISVLGLYLGIVLILAALAILLTVLILILHHREGKPEHDCLIMKLTSFAAKVTCMKQYGVGSCMDTSDNKVQPMHQNADKDSLASLDLKTTDVNISTNVIKNTDSKTPVTPFGGNDVTWKEVAAILDRFCFASFLTLTVTMNISFVVALTVGSRVSGIKE